MLFGAKQDRLGMGWLLTPTLGSQGWECRGVCRVPVTAEFMASARQKTPGWNGGFGTGNLLLPCKSCLQAWAPLDTLRFSTPHWVFPAPCSQQGRGRAEAILQEAWLGCLWTLLLPCESQWRCQGSCWWHRRRFVPALQGYYGNWGEGEQTDGAESQPAWGDFRALCRGVAGNCWGGLCVEQRPV